MFAARPSAGKHDDTTTRRYDETSRVTSQDIDAGAAGHIGLHDAAAIAGLTPWHFARAFRQRFGVPPHRFQLGRRIDLARRLLADGAGASDVAQRTGFADQSHFIRVFKRMTGTTPSRYRRAQRTRLRVFEAALPGRRPEECPLCRVTASGVGHRARTTS